ncbi:AI-2E family transporter [Arhodomonas aquaeolei]|uniref:AI-2E family transporter n=1 Tax=Arhodomonas TaxID=2368 RepID=UPI0003605513|nr:MULTISPECIES: AI-2E family transporter [Arhodomonas]MCS4504821.1 AI-2E family transporter [Arhodomonas aquaeolei]
MEGTGLRDRQAWPLLAAVIGGGVLIYLLRGMLTPFLVAAVLAYISDPIADRLEARGLSRTLSVVIVFGATLGVVIGVALMLLPLLAHQVDYLVQRLPAIVDWVQRTAVPWMEEHLGVSASRLDVQTLRDAVTQHWQSTGSVAAAVIARATQSGLALVGLITNLALIPVVGFYLLRDWDVLMERIRELLPRSVQGVVGRLGGECNEVVAAFLRGQLLVMLALGAIYTTGLWLVGLNLAILIGMLSGLANIVPYLGFIVGITTASVAAVFQFNDILVPLLLVWAVFGIGQTLEGMVLTPLLVGDRIGLHPVAVIFAVLAGGQLFGFAGVLLALPVAAVIAVLLRHAHDRYVHSTLYHGIAGADGEAGEEQRDDNPTRD